MAASDDHDHTLANSFHSIAMMRAIKIPLTMNYSMATFRVRDPLVVTLWVFMHTIHE